MKDKIKEILARLSRYVITPDVRHDFDDLLNYITNLQEENKHLDKVNCHLRKKINNDIYKSRNEKARELISKEFLCYDNESDECIQGKKVINILNGGDEE